MKIEKEAAQQLIDELTKSKVVVTYVNKKIKTTVQFLNSDKKTGEIDEVVHEFDTSFRPFSISINNKFLNSYEEISLYPDPKYRLHLGNLRNKVIAEIDNNINLRIGKWDIFNYLTNLTSELQEIRNKFGVSEVVLQSEEGKALNNSRFPIAEGESPDYDNLNIEIIVKADDGVKELTQDDIFNMNTILARYWDIQVLVIERLMRILEQRTSIIEKTEDYVQTINSLPPQSLLQWKKSDTDLLELIVALNESGSIFCNNTAMTRKQTIEYFEDLFGIKIKDPESKLSRATERKKDQAPYLTFLKQTFDNYSKKKIE